MTTAVKFIVACSDCGQEFSGTRFMGLPMQYYCGDCRERRHRQFMDDQQRRNEASLAYRRREWLQNPDRGVPRRYWGQTWDDFKFDMGGEPNRGRVAGMRGYAEAFPMKAAPIGQGSLLLCSPMNGVGKTMLASLVLSTLIDRYEETARERCPFQFWSVNRMRQRLESARRFGSAETAEDVYRDFASMWLLIMDDVGKERLDGYEAGATYDMYFNIIDSRYNARLPVIITSNLGFEPWNAGGPSLVDLMGRASVSRLMEMTGGQYYAIDGEDRR